MIKSVLFLCPHHAAKSVIAEAYLRRLAEERGLNVQVASAGTEPDERVSPITIDLLRAEGIDVSDHRPRQITRAELDSADYVISMGGTAAELDLPAERVEMWNDVPPVSQNAIVARDAIRAHVAELVERLEKED